MPRTFTPKVVTANALIEGDVIYLSTDDSWTRDLAKAELLTDEGHANLRLLMAEGAARSGGRRLSGRCRIQRHTAPNPPISARSSAAPGHPTIPTASSGA